MKRIGTAALSAISAVALSTTFLAAPAYAGNGHGNGNGHGAEHGNPHDSSSTYTEDNDTNDGGTPNNVADDGDNAHPSGRDRSVEHGNSGNQGNAQSDPDDDGRGPDRSNGGADKPNGPGGVDRADQDGNNGCGNDDDFEDDNEGWCGHHPHPSHESKPHATTTTSTAPPAHCADDEHMTSGGTCAHDETVGAPADHEDTPSTPTADDDDDTPAVHHHHDHEHLHDVIVTSPSDDTDVAGNAGEAECTDAATMPAGSTTEDDCNGAECTGTMTSGTSADDEDTADCGEVMGLELERGGVTTSGAGTATPAVLAADLAAATSPAPSVLGTETSRGALASVAAGSLAFTGDHIMLMVIAGLLTLLVGWVLVRQARRNGGATTA
jgi:hypothetical protein